MILLGPFIPQPVVLDSKGKLAAVAVVVTKVDATVVFVDIAVVKVVVVDVVVADEVIVDIVTVVVDVKVIEGVVAGCELVACVDEVVGFVLVSESSDIEVVVVFVTGMIETVDVVIDEGKVVTVSVMHSSLEKKYSNFTLMTGYTEYQIFMKKSIT